MGSKKQHKVTALLLAGIMMFSAPAVCAEEIATPEIATPETATPEMAVTYDMPLQLARAAAPVVLADTPDYTKGDASREIAQGTFTKSDSKYYGNATFYDYYGDNERQGIPIRQLTVGVLGGIDGWNDQGAFQWNDAIDAYFKDKKVDPLYFGGARFFNAAGNRIISDLHRWSKYRTFGNGSADKREITSSDAFFPNQGIAAPKLGDNDQLLLNIADGPVEAPSNTPPPKPTAPSFTPVPQTTATPKPTPAAVQTAAIPQTSDPMPAGMLMLLANLSFAGIALCVLRRRKANYQQKHTKL